ncbi:MAG: FAD-dependent oxidoreductase, partial [Planctomycetota bacterium]
MAREFQLPEVSEGVTDAEVSEIMVAEGDVIEPGQTVMEVETEKAAAPVECPFGGTITKIHVAEGDTVPIGGVLLTIEDGGAPPAKDGGGSAEKPAAAAKSAEAPAAAVPSPAPAADAGSGDYEYDLVVLGGGPGGYPAAFEAADHGLKVALVDDNPQQGGVCLRVGCIPSKTLLHVAKLLHEAEEAKNWGVHFEKPTIDLAKLRDFKGGVVNRLTGGIGQLGKARGVDIVQGRGTFVDSHTLTVDTHAGETKSLTFKQAIIAVGSSPAMPGVFDIGDDRVMDSTGALELEDVPGKLLVVGGGYIGLEMGSVYAALGSEVTVVEATPHLVPAADRD